MTTETPERAPMGLRDRKRIATRTRIEDAAVFLVLRNGLDETTVDAISERAEISPRTFFNYFESKDGAILGVPLVDPDEEVTVDPDADFVTGVVDLLLDAMGVTADRPASLQDDRRELIRRHPQVVSAQMGRLTARAERLTAAIAERMSIVPAFADDPDRAARAEVVLALCGGAVRTALKEHVAEGGRRPVSTIAERATALITTTTRKL